MALSTATIKVVTTIAIFVLTLLASLLPYKLRASKRFLSICNVLAGGIFLGAGLCHLLADSVEQFNEYYEDEHHHHDDDDHDHDHDPQQLTHGGDDSHFPWPFVMMGIGFLATLFVELIAHQLTHKTPSDDKKNETVQNSQTEPFLQAQGDYLVDSSVNQRDGVDPHNQGLIATPENSFYSHFSGDHGHSHGNHHGHSHAHDSSHDDHGHSHLPMDTANQSIIVVLALFLALSFHSIVEGISLGSSDGDTVKSIMIAILAHKGLESFSLGTSLINSNASTLKYITFCLIFSLMTPIGVIIGALVLSNTEGIVSAFITGFAAGTFTYVSIVEVLLPEFKKQQDLLFKAIAASVGFAGMAIIALWV